MSATKKATRIFFGSGIYGFGAIEGNAYDRTRVVGEFTLAKYKYDPGGLIRSRGFNDGDLSEIALLGAVRR